MSKQSVTAGIYEYLKPDNSNIPNFGTLYSALPKIANESDLFLNSFPGQQTGGVIYMFITRQSERRIALGGEHDGRKFRTYDLGLLIVFKSEQQLTEDGQRDFDAFIDALTAFIQANRVPNIPWSDIFQWGEGTELGGPDIQIDYTIPRTIDGQTLLFQAVAHLTVAEVLDT